MLDTSIMVYMAGFAPECLEREDKIYQYFALHLVVRGGIDLRWSRNGPWTEYPAPVAWAGWPGQYLAWRSSAPRAHYRTAIVGAAPAAWLEEGLLPRRPVLVGDLPRAESHWQRYLPVSTCSTVHERRLAVHALEGFLLDLAEADSSSEGASVLSLRAAIDLDPLTTPDYAQWARRSRCSLATLRRRFQAACGMPLHRYVLERRCAEARRLLADSDDSLERIARQLGYRDVFYFTRQFRRLVGLPPATFRRTLRR